MNNSDIVCRVSIVKSSALMDSPLPITVSIWEVCPDVHIFPSNKNHKITDVCKTGKITPPNADNFGA